MAAVITGAGRGIGRAIALEAAKAGHAVALQARTAPQLEIVREEIEALGGRAVIVPGDVTQASSAEALVERCLEAFGSVDVAVAGAGQAMSAPIERTDEAQFRQLFEVNALAPFHLMKAAAPKMTAGGRIVVIASIASVKGMRYTGAYCASKHAVLGLVKSAALELAKRSITVNALCPGWVDTAMFDTTLDNISVKTGCSRDEARGRIESMIPIGRVLEVDEVAAMFRYMISPEAGKLTGQAMLLDGGETL